MAQTVTLFGTFHPLYLMSARGADSLNISEDGDELIIKHRADIFQVFWIFLFVASSIYSFCWDVYMDWGLGRKEVSPFPLFVYVMGIFLLKRFSYTSLVWFPWASIDVSQEKLLLHGHSCRSSTSVYVGYNFGSTSIW